MSQKDISMGCIKYMLLCVTAIFVITSALIISVGTTIYALYHNVSFFLDDRYLTPATFIIILGIIMLFVSLFGCIGALKESTCLVNIFAVILSLVLVLEVAAAITAYSLRSSLAEMLDDRLRATLPGYYHDPEVKGAYDFLQSRLSCCGIDGYMDWADATPPPGEPGLSASNITVPNSCCAATHYEDLISGEGLSTEICDKMYINGCLPRFYFVIYQSAGLLGAAAITIAFVQIIGIVFSFSLAVSIRRAKSERERRKWEIRERVLAQAALNPDNEKAKPIVYVPFQGQPLA